MNQVFILLYLYISKCFVFGIEGIAPHLHSYFALGFGNSVFTKTHVMHLTFFVSNTCIHRNHSFFLLWHVEHRARSVKKRNVTWWCEEVILVYHLFLWLAITNNLSLPLTLQREQIYLNTWAVQFIYYIECKWKYKLSWTGPSLIFFQNSYQSNTNTD